MSVTSWIVFKFYENSKPFRFTNFLEICENANWKIFSHNQKVFYLSAEDDDGSDWVSEFITELQLFETLNRKQLKGDIIGIVLAKYPENNGCSVLYYPDQPHSLSVDIAIDRKLTFEGMTDVSWYLNEMKKIFDICGYQIESIEFSEHQ
jgi:hypothetical protein